MQYISIPNRIILHSRLLLFPQLSSASSNMINFFQNVFVRTISWSQTGQTILPACRVNDRHRHSNSFSFSLDGTILAGTIMIDCTGKPDNVHFWDTATGTATCSFESSSFVVFSPTDTDVAVIRLGSIHWHMLKRDSLKGKTWGGQFSHDSTPDAVCAFDSNGKTIVMSWDKKYLREYDPTTSNWFNNIEKFRTIWLPDNECRLLSN